MAYALMGLGALIGLITLVCAIIVIIAAFKEAPLHGQLCFFCGPYLIYYAFAKFTHAHKGLILAGLFGSAVLSGICYGIGGALLAKDLAAGAGFMSESLASEGTPGVAAPAAGDTATTPAATGDSIGIPECDEYITKYEKCLEDKVPAAAKAQMKQGLDTMRQSWKQAASTPAGKAGLAQGCKQAMAAAKTAMGAYGCQF